MEDLATLARMARNLVWTAERACEHAADAAEDKELELAWGNHARALKVAEALERMRDAARDTRPEAVRKFDRVAERAEYRAVVDAGIDFWVTACCGDEEPMARGGSWVLYQWNPVRQAHRYLDLVTLEATAA